MITLYHKVTHTPVTLARLLRDELLVTPYRKPERVGMIYLPPQSLADKTQTLWEILLSNEAAEEELGMPLPPGTIVQTLRRWPRDTGLVTEDGRPAMLWPLSCGGCPEHRRPTRLCGLRGVITYTNEEDNDAAS